MSNPIRTTVIFGLLSALCIIPVHSFLIYGAWPIAFKLFFLLNLALYSVLLCRWSGTRLAAVFFPLLLLFVMALWPYSTTGFLVFSLAVLSWIRSGICFKNAPIRGILAETVIMAGGAGFVMFWWASLPQALPLAIWLFFLVQALYFYIIPTVAEHDAAADLSDSFEQARREMERILETPSL